MARITKEQLAYIAGFIDGEGYVGLTKRESNGKVNSALKPVVQISNSYLPVLEMILDLFPGGHLRVKKPQPKETKPHHVLIYEGQSLLIYVLEMLIPYLVEKKWRAEVVVDWCRRRIKIGGKRHPYTENDWEDYERLLIQRRK